MAGSKASHLAELPRDRWADTAIRVVMQRIAEPLTASPGDNLWTVFQKLSANGLGRVAVVDGERLVGYLSTKDVLHVLTVSSARAEGGSQSREVSPPAAR